MVICYILGCKSRSERKSQNITYHTFPKDSAIRQLWIRATGPLNWQPTKYTRICSRHFEQSCFRKTAGYMTYLKAFSIPTLHVVEELPMEDMPTSNQVPMEIASTPYQVPMEMPSISNQVSTEIVSTSKQVPMEIASISTQVEHSTLIEKSTEVEITPRKQKLFKQLNRQTLLAQTRKKKLAILRSKNQRLMKKNAELSAIVEKLQEKPLISPSTYC